MSATTTDALDVDVAIIGAGVGGVYTAWRLATSSQYRGKKIAVFEQSQRVGGRLVSAQPPGMPHVTVELGGMRFFSTQRNIDGLVRQELDLPVEVLPSDEPENIGFFRGQQMRRWQVDPPTTSHGTGPFPYRIEGGYHPPPAFPYRPTWEEAQIAPSDLLVYAVMAAVPAYDPSSDSATREKVLREATFDGTPLLDWGFWNLLARVLSTEGYELMKAVVGYGSTFLNWNAVNSIVENLDFDPSVEKFRLVGGYTQVPALLADRFTDAGGTITFGHRLRELDVVSAGGRDRAVARFDVTAADGQVTEQVVAADHLVLAMPRTALEALRPVGRVLGRDQADVREMLRTVTPDPLFKVALAYPEPWWTPYGVTQGRSLSDQPIRQCYYWGVEGQQPGGDPANTNSLLLLYNDADSMDFFGGYMGSQDVFRTRSNPWIQPGTNGSVEWARHPAPRRLVDEAHRQVREMHGARSAPEPYAAAAAQWAGWPYGGGANFWNAGVDSREMIPKVVQPKPDLPVYIVGEAYSNSQSWVEGALETSEIALQDKFGLPAPGWIGPTT